MPSIFVTSESMVPLRLILKKAVARFANTFVSIRDQISQTATDAIASLRVKSALNPILWLCGIAVLGVVAILPFCPHGAPTWLIVLLMTPFGVACIGFLYLLFFDPDKLQSEDYQLRKQSLEIVQQKGQDFLISPASLEAITNPEHPKKLKDGSV